MRTKQTIVLFALTALTISFFSCTKNGIEAPPDPVITSNANLIAQITTTDSQSLSTGVVLYKEIFLYDGQNRLIKINGVDPANSNLVLESIEYNYNGADTVPSDYTASTNGKVAFKYFYNYKNGIVKKDSLVNYSPTGQVGNIEVSEYLDSLGSYVQYFKAYRIVNGAITGIAFKDTLELTYITKNTKGQITNWGEYTNSGADYREFTCSYTATDNPYYYYNRRNIYPVDADFGIGSALGFLIPLFQHDTKNLPLSVKEYTIGNPANVLRAEHKFEYGYDANGRLNLTTMRFSRDNGFKKTLIQQITYK